MRLSEQFELELYGMTKPQALEKGVCINCKKVAKDRIYSKDGAKEYMISAYCEICFDALTKED